jgi:hypothetical protein
MTYKLIYTDQDTAIADLFQKGVLINALDLEGNNVTAYSPTTRAVVYIGQIVDTPAVFKDMKVITPATYIDGYHVDVMTDIEIKFDNEIFPNNPKHLFA